jgi:hypothetical protein
MNGATGKMPNTAPGLRGYLFLEACGRMLIWGSSLLFTLVIFGALRSWPELPGQSGGWPVAWSWAVALAELVLIYNVIYLAELMILRLPMPSIKEGEYEFKPGAPFDFRVLWVAFNSIILRARYQAPFPAFLRRSAGWFRASSGRRASRACCSIR